jgi:hypothetical protein
MSDKKIVVMPKSEYDRLESAWQDAELRAERAEARVKELEGIVSLCYDTIGNMKDSHLQELER